MKKLLSASMIAVASLGIATAASAQQTKTGSTTLHVIITDALDLTVNDPLVELKFLTAADYQTGVTADKVGHLTISSNQAYNLDVQTTSDQLAGTGTNTEKIDASTVAVSIDNSSATAMGGTVTPVSALAMTAKPLAAGAKAVSGQSVDVKYEIPAAISQTAAILGKPADTYETHVTYTLTQI